MLCVTSCVPFQVLKEVKASVTVACNPHRALQQHTAAGFYDSVQAVIRCGNISIIKRPW